jgi:hypothetical protein
MKTILITIFSFFSLTLLGQSNKELCESGVRQAQKRLANGEIYFPRDIFDSSITLRKILEMDYGIIDGSYSKVDFGFQAEDECFDSVMLKAISDKWGADFLAKQKQLADKWVAEGKGYKTPLSVDKEKVIDQMMRKGYTDNGIRLKRFRIDLVISSDGKIVKQEIHSLSEGEVTAKEISIINDAIAKYSDNWAPGELRGIPMEMGTYIQIGKWVTGPAQ